jgi:hypothetical protein
MPFYIRKSVSVGPFRFNLSSRGLGMSAGVKGLRIGTGPRGNYIQMGRGGLYYRASLGGSPQRSQTVPQQQPIPSVQPSSGLAEVEVGDVLQMIPSNAGDVLSQINDRMSAMSLWPFLLIFGLAAVYFVGTTYSNPNYLYGTMGLTVLLISVAAYLDKIRKTVVIMYDLEPDIEAAYGKFSEAFAEAGDCQKIWNVNASGSTDDWKRHAGASRLLTRTNAAFSYSVPSVVKTNIDVPCIAGGKQNIYFFPDIVLITDKGKAGAVTYKDLNVDWGTTTFIESDGVPKDSQVVGQTWRYVNKNGGPDRRFNNNRQIPEVCYQTMILSSAYGLQKMLHLSKVADRHGFDNALRGMAELVSNLSQTPAKHHSAKARLMK